MVVNDLMRNEIIQIGKKYRVLLENINGNQKWVRYSFWTHAKDVFFDDGTSLDQRIGSIKGITNNIDDPAGNAADVTLVKNLKTYVLKLINNLTTELMKLKNELNFRLGGAYTVKDGGIRICKDLNDTLWAEWLVNNGQGGADTVRKKLGEGDYKITKVIVTDNASSEWNPTVNGVFPPPGYNVVTPETMYTDDNGVQHNVAIMYDQQDGSKPIAVGLDFMKYLRWAGLEATDRLYENVYVQIDSVSINKYDSPDHRDPATGSNADKLWRDSITALYDLNSSSVRFHLGEFYYQGGENAFQMTILYN